MANENQLIIEVSADTVELVKALSTVKNGLQDFAKDGKTTAATITSALKAINDQSKNTFDITALSIYNKSADELKKILQEIRKIGLSTPPIPPPPPPDDTEALAKANEKLQIQAKRARVALLGVNQVVRDLPFGFIAISNNLPVLFDQFAALKAESTSTKEAFKLLGKQILGAGGLTLGFSLLITGITTLVQKYGSLSNAYKALTSSLGPLIEKLDKASKEFAKLAENANSVSDLQIKASIGTEQEIKDTELLIKALNNENTTRGEKETIIGRIQSANQGIFKDYVIEKENINELSKALTIYNGLLVAQEETKAFREEIGTNSKVIFEQTKLLKQLGAELGAAEKEYAAAQKVVNEFRFALGTSGKVAGEQRLDAAIKSIAILRTEYAALAKNIDKVIKTNDDLRKAVDDGTITEIQAQTKLTEFLDANFKTKKQLTAEERNSIKVIKEASKGREELLKLDIQGYKDRIKNLDLFATDAIKIFQELEKAEIELAVIDAKKVFAGPELAEAIKKISKNIREKISEEYQNIITAREDFIQKQEELNTKELEQIDNYINATTEAYNKIDFGGVNRKLNNFYKTLDAGNKQFDKSLKNQGRNIEQLRLQIRDVFAGSIANSFSGFIDQLVDGFDDGVKAGEAFKETLEDLGKTILKEIAKLALLTAIRVAFDAIAPGTGAVAASAAGTGLNRIGRQRNGLNVGPGGLALAGQVTFVQRGPDLVGVLQQANGRINRVG